MPFLPDCSLNDLFELKQLNAVPAIQAYDNNIVPVLILLIKCLKKPVIWICVVYCLILCHLAYLCMRLYFARSRQSKQFASFICDPLMKKNLYVKRGLADKSTFRV